MIIFFFRFFVVRLHCIIYAYLELVLAIVSYIYLLLYKYNGNEIRDYYRLLNLLLRYTLLFRQLIIITYTVYIYFNISVVVQYRWTYLCHYTIWYKMIRYHKSIIIISVQHITKCHNFTDFSLNKVSVFSFHYTICWWYWNDLVILDIQLFSWFKNNLIS